MLYVSGSSFHYEVDNLQLAPAGFLIEMKNKEMAGQHCLQYTHPNFRQGVKEGFNIVVAGKAFGCGSSREEAVMALLGKFKHPVVRPEANRETVRLRCSMCNRQVLRVYLPAQHA